MDWIELTIHTTTAGADIVSEALMAEGATGTMVEDRADIPDPDKPNGYWEIIDPNLIASMPEDVLVHAWFTPDSSFADRMQALRSRCDELHHMDLGLDLGTLEISTLNVRDEDWAEVWKKFYKPFKAGRSLVVKPTWEHYDPQPGDRTSRMTPAWRRFRARTRRPQCAWSCWRTRCTAANRSSTWARAAAFSPSARRCSARRTCLPSTLTPWRCAWRRRTLSTTTCPTASARWMGNLLASSDGVCDLCVANIIADVICMFAQPLVDHIVPGGLFICSGIIKEREQDVVNALTAADYTILETKRKGEWVAMLSRRKK